MIGKKKLSEIRAGIVKACAKAGIDPAVWMEEEISKANRATPRNKAEIETLLLVRDGLRAAGSNKRRVRARSK
ncbi:MAG TPA: hypothetical protein VJ783_03510 [Pirellulales bacterium]|nr:hypothetical protein [Pirellulales bacterium]